MSDVDVISPELALVDADARHRAISSLAMPRWHVPSATVTWQVGTRPSGQPFGPLVLSAGVYFAAGMAQVLFWGLAVIGALAVVAGIGFVL